MQNWTLNGKSAVVTGRTRGIGRGVAEALLEAGATVVISGTNADKGKRALEEIDAGDRARFTKPTPVVRPIPRR